MKIEFHFDQKKLIKDFRQKRLIESPISTIDLAQKIKVSRSTMNRLEKGSKIDLETFIKICNYLECNPSIFFIKK